MNINYEYYRIFYYAAKYKNFTQAAQILHNSQPNISRTIKLLEHDLGCRLFVRSNRGIALTPEGERLYLHVKAAVERIHFAENEMARSIHMQDGCVTIGASETALYMLLLPVLRQFKKNHPQIRIRILNHLTMQAVESAKRGEVDFAVAVDPPEIEKPLICHPVIQFQDILIGGFAYRMFENKPVTLRDLSALPLISLMENTVTYRFYENFYLRHGRMFLPELQAATTDQILPMIKSDLGIGYLPETYAKEALEKREVFRFLLQEEIPTREICLIENEEYPLNIAAKELKTLLFHNKNSSAHSSTNTTAHAAVDT